MIMIFRLAYLSICGTFFSPKAFELLNQNKVIHYEHSKLQPIASEIVVKAHRGASE
jgi:hypothetical protein